MSVTTTVTATREQRDSELYASFILADRNATSAAKSAGVPRSTMNDAVKRHEARLAQDGAAETTPEPEAAPQAIETTPEPAAEPQPAKAAKADLPEGVVTPVAFRHLLVAEGLALETLRTQTVYDWVKHSAGNKLPVKHYSMADGTEHDSAQRDEAGKATTRPGVAAEAGRAWVAAKYPIKGAAA